MGGWLKPRDREEANFKGTVKTEWRKANPLCKITHILVVEVEHCRANAS